MIFRRKFNSMLGLKMMSTKSREDVKLSIIIIITKLLTTSSAIYYFMPLVNKPIVIDPLQSR